MRPRNVGAGISYLISIQITCLSAPEDSVNIIENPELHLHPESQAKVCEFFYFIGDAGRQIFIETNSDHIFNGFRVGIAAGEMEKQLVNIQFIYLNDSHVSEVMKVKIGRMGRIENQRKDLFGQFESIDDDFTEYFKSTLRPVMDASIEKRVSLLKRRISTEERSWKRKPYRMSCIGLMIRFLHCGENIFYRWHLKNPIRIMTLRQEWIWIISIP